MFCWWMKCILKWHGWSFLENSQIFSLIVGLFVYPVRKTQTHENSVRKEEVAWSQKKKKEKKNRSLSNDTSDLELKKLKLEDRRGKLCNLKLPTVCAI